MARYWVDTLAGYNLPFINCQNKWENCQKPPIFLTKKTGCQTAGFAGVGVSFR
jgi:hypothetical protein